MFKTKLLRPLSLLTLFFFIFFIGVSDISLAQEEDVMLKARQLYMEGDYEGAIDTLSDFITKLRALEEQKKNVAEAFYLLAKIYFEVGDDVKVHENLHKVFDTYPTFNKEEINLGFKEHVEKVRAEILGKKEREAAAQEARVRQQEEKIKAKPRIIEQTTPKKKKKKFPILLVAAGVVVVAVLVILLTKKKDKDKDIEDVYDIRGDWAIYDTSEGELLFAYYTFGGSLTSGTFVDHDGDTGIYSVSNRNVSFEYDDYDIYFTGSFSNFDNMNGTYTSVLGTRTWRGERGAFASSLVSSGNLKEMKQVSKKPVNK